MVFCTYPAELHRGRAQYIVTTLIKDFRYYQEGAATQKNLPSNDGSVSYSLIPERLGK
jgi:hypothetical protein